MQRSQWLAATVLVIAFAVGGALGFSVDHFIHAKRAEGCQPSDVRAYWDRIGREWKLTPAQRLVVDSLMDVQHRKIAALFAPVRRQVDSLSIISQQINDSTQAQLRGILTPEQRRQMDAMHVEARRQAAARRACRDQEMAKIR